MKLKLLVMAFVVQLLVVTSAQAVIISVFPANTGLFETEVQVGVVTVETVLAEDANLAGAQKSQVAGGFAAATSELGFDPAVSGDSVKIDFSQDVSGASGVARAVSQTGLGNGLLDPRSAAYSYSVAADTEPAGTIFDVTVDFILSGSLNITRSVSDSDQAFALWSLLANDNEVVNSGGLIQGVDGDRGPFNPPVTTDVQQDLADSGSVSFQVADGDAFSLTLSLQSLAGGTLGTNAVSSALFSGEINVFAQAVDPLNPIPVPAAVWLFGTALIGLVGFSKRKKVA